MSDSSEGRHGSGPFPSHQRTDFTATVGETMFADPRRYNTDKYADLLRTYESFLAPWQDVPLVLLELGVGAGGSLLMWRDCLPKGLIVGLDKESVPREVSSERVRVYQGLQEDTALLDRIAREVAPDGFSIIIDDASHIGAVTRISFWHLFHHHLKPGGIYAIEDWGTGYWDSWPDGRRWVPPAETDRAGAAGLPATKGSRSGHFPSHQHGLVGFVKELIDEVGIEDATRNTPLGASSRSNLVAELHVFPALVVAVKAQDPQSAPGIAARE